jgi:hypothetical protein
MAHEFSGSDADLIYETIISVLNHDLMENDKELANIFSDTMIDLFLNDYKDKLDFNFVFDKVYSAFREPLFCELVFDTILEKLKTKHDIVLEQKVDI